MLNIFCSGNPFEKLGVLWLKVLKINSNTLIKMKKILLMLVLGFSMMACEKDDDNTPSLNSRFFSPINTAELPTRVTTHIHQSYPSAQILVAGSNASFGYEVIISYGWNLYYDTTGAFIYKKDDDDDDDYIPVAVSSLPSSIITYVDTNYPNDSIVWAERDDDEYDVYLNSGWELTFDLSGNFIEAERDEIPVNPADLPANILSYIQQNYPNASIVKAELDDNIYEVYLNNGIELYFSLNGTFLGFDVDDQIIPINNLPQVILDYVATNYPNQSIVKAEIDDNMYEVELNNEVELYFDLAGNFLFAEFD